MLSLVTMLLAAAPQNVILITWDGARWQDVFDRSASAPLPRFWAKHAEHATVLGDPATKVRFEVANDSLVSLPGYQELMVGGPVDCRTNLCGQVERETVVDAIAARGLTYRVFGSWWHIVEAATQKESPWVDAGRQDGEPGMPWGMARGDRLTWSKAMSALEKQPRFMWISMNDGDEWAHRGRREAYVLTLRRYDAWLDELLQKLQSMPGYGENTTVIVTTDHGRGDGRAWTDHGWETPEARQIFAFMIGPGTGAKLGGAEKFTHRDVRPTIEALLGLPAASAALPGVVPAEGGVMSAAASR